MELNTNRIGLLIRREFILNGKRSLLGIFGVVGIAILFSFLGLLFSGTISADNYSLFTSMFFIILSIGIATSMFKEWNKTETGFQIMVLPASNLEKVLSKWIIAILIYPIVAVLIILVGASLLHLLGSFGLEIDGDIYRFSKLWALVKIHLIMGPIFFLGGVTFKNNVFFKTILACFVIVSSLFAVTGTASYFLFKGNSNIANGPFFQYYVNSITTGSLQILPTLLLLVFVLFLLVVSYFKIKEREL